MYTQMHTHAHVHRHMHMYTDTHKCTCTRLTVLLECLHQSAGYSTYVCRYDCRQKGLEKRRFVICRHTLHLGHNIRVQNSSLPSAIFQPKLAIISDNM